MSEFLKSPLRVKFWGVRGSCPASGKEYAHFGGHTSCVSVSAETPEGKVPFVIFDAGSGLIELGNELISLQKRDDIHIFLSHVHMDHVMGLPFFKPLWTSGTRVHFWADPLSGHCDLKSYFRQVFSPPFFPVTIEDMPADIIFHDIPAGELVELDKGITLNTRALNHPDGALGYRLQWGKRVISYVTDTEHTPGQDDQNVVDLMTESDLVVYDATYTEPELLEKYTGWGHSTWQEGVRLGKKYGAKQVALFHHESLRSDSDLNALEKEAQKKWPCVFAAREGERVFL
ncbi:MAG: MBL fold metallo-hydrolase [bacterium]|nr:MBL fold metallo-hydrolase [bacterium]